jgi:hypothetical protein
MSEHDTGRGRYLLKHYTHVDKPDTICGTFDTILECGEYAIEHHKQSSWSAILLTAVKGVESTHPIFYACIGDDGCSMDIDGDNLFYPDWYEHYVVTDLVAWKHRFGKDYDLQDIASNHPVK